MISVTEIYLLESITDNPIFEGFGGLADNKSLLGRDSMDDDMNPYFGCNSRVWKPVSLSKIWKAPKVTGRVTPFNDFPGVDLYPAFSKRAIDLLGNLLEPNGEILPLKTTTGEFLHLQYYNYQRCS